MRKYKKLIIYFAVLAFELLLPIFLKSDLIEQRNGCSTKYLIILGLNPVLLGLIIYYLNKGLRFMFRWNNLLIIGLFLINYLELITNHRIEFCIAFYLLLFLNFGMVILFVLTENNLKIKT